MKIFKILLIALFLSFDLPLGLAGEICPEKPGYFCITPEMAPDSVIKIFDFYNIPGTIISLFSQELKQKSAPIWLDAQWESPFFGAGVALTEGRYRLMILGGTTRISGMSLDAYAAIVCHELGHVIGGSPIQPHGIGEFSAEGQADFFAASVCLPRFFKSQGDKSEDEIYERVEQAGYEMIFSFTQISTTDERIERHMADPYVAPEALLYAYPSLQCRYENFRNPFKRPMCWFKE